MVKGPARVCHVAFAMACLALTFAPGAAHAHPEPMPALVNRYVTLMPAGARLGIEFSLLYGSLPAGEKRRALDTDRDGTLSPQEIGLERRALLARAGELVRLFIDGVPVTLEPTLDIDLGGDRGTGAQPLVVSLRGSVALDPGERRLAIALGPDLPRMGETEVMLDAGNPWRLHESFDGAAQVIATAPLVRYATARAKPDEPRGGGFVIRADGPLAGESGGLGSATAPLIMVLIAIALGVALMMLVRKLDRPRAP